MRNLDKISLMAFYNTVNINFGQSYVFDSCFLYWSWKNKNEMSYSQNSLVFLINKKNKWEIILNVKLK